MNIILYVIAALQTLGALVAVWIVGKPRKPVSGPQAARALAVTALIVTALIIAAGRLG